MQTYTLVYLSASFRSGTIPNTIETLYIPAWSYLIFSQEIITNWILHLSFSCILFYSFNKHVVKNILVLFLNCCVNVNSTICILWFAFFKLYIVRPIHAYVHTCYSFWSVVKYLTVYTYPYVTMPLLIEACSYPLAFLGS